MNLGPLKCFLEWSHSYRQFLSNCILSVALFTGTSDSLSVATQPRNNPFESLVKHPTCCAHGISLAGRWRGQAEVGKARTSLDAPSPGIVSSS